jgi:hypothetical protein
MMKHYINCGFNLLLHGVGSKRAFLNYFSQMYLNGEPRLIINGYHSATSMKTITNGMLSFAGKHNLPYAEKGKKSGTHSVGEQVDKIRRIYGKLDEESPF